MAGSVIKRTDSRGRTRWQAKLWCKDQEGAWHWETGTFDTQREAKAALLRWQTDEEEPDWSTRSLAEYMRLWLDTVKRHKVKRTTYESYAWQIEARILPKLGHIRLCNLTPQQIQSFYSEEKDLGGRRTRTRKQGNDVVAIPDSRPLSARMVRYSHSLLHAALEHATRTGLIPNNPTAHLELPRKDAKAGLRWTDTQARAFLAAAASHQYGPVWLVALATGLRPGELKGVRWEDLDFEARTLRVAQQVSPVKGGKIKQTPKGNRARTIRLAPITIAMLRRHREIVTELAYDNPAWEEHSLVFPSRTGRPLTSTPMRRVFDALCLKAGVPRIRLHDLRHTSASLALEAGIPLKTISERLGHADPRTTMSIYVHAKPETEDHAASTIEALITTGEPAP